MADGADLARELLGRASDDEAATREMLSVPAVTDAIVGFHAQQAAEKALKAVLALNQVEFPFTHDLSALDEVCNEHGISLPAELADLDRLTPYAARARYGGSDPRTVDRREALQLASASVAWARSLIGA